MNPGLKGDLGAPGAKQVSTPGKYLKRKQGWSNERCSILPITWLSRRKALKMSGRMSTTEKLEHMFNFCYYRVDPGSRVVKEIFMSGTHNLLGASAPNSYVFITRWRLGNPRHAYP